MNTWVVMVDATKYNLFGAARKYGDNIPWFFDGVKGGTPQVDDKVLFYFTASDSSNGSKKKQKHMDTLFKRVVFEGVITAVGANLSNADIDLEYWDKDHAAKLRSTCKDLVMIEIKDTLYDDANRNKLNISNNRFVENMKTYVIKL